MKNDKPLFVIRSEPYGSGTPFFARLFLFIMQLRDKLIFTDKEKMDFDKIYGRFYESAKAAYLAFRELVKLHYDYIESIDQNNVVRVINNTIQIDRTIDDEARRLTNVILSEAEIAYKGYVNEIPKLFDNFDLGFMAQKDSRFQTGLSNIRKIDGNLADYLEKNRDSWGNQLTEIRNQKEHKGWLLPNYQFGINPSGDGVITVAPKIESTFFLDYLGELIAGLFTFAEELSVYLLSSNLEYEYVSLIPPEERNKQNISRFRIVIVGTSLCEPWTLKYTGPDYSLIE